MCVCVISSRQISRSLLASAIAILSLPFSLNSCLCRKCSSFRPYFMQGLSKQNPPSQCAEVSGSSRSLAGFPGQLGRVCAETKGLLRFLEKQSGCACTGKTFKAVAPSQPWCSEDGCLIHKICSLCMQCMKRIINQPKCMCSS